MKLTPKLAIVLAAVALGAFVTYREASALCGPQKVDAHGHGQEHGEPETGAHAKEGFGTKVCEDGVLRAAWETLTSARPQMEANAQKEAEASHKEGDGHDHTKEDSGAKDEHGHGHDEKEGSSEGLVKLSLAQIKAADIEMLPAASGKLSKEIVAPGRITMNADAEARVVPKLSGTVASVEKQLGDTVAKGDLLATIESREIADAKADFMAASRGEELARTTFEREERLWKQKVTAEQEFLAASNAHAEAKIKLDVAHQRLHAIGLSEGEISGLPKIGDESSFRIYELRAPIAGQVAARNLVLGQSVGTEKEVFVIADPAKVWIEMAVAPNDLSFAQRGQEVRIQSGSRQATATIIALSPVIDPETRSAKAIAVLDNTTGLWKAGDYVDARLITSVQEVDIVVPREAIQTIKGSKVVFVNEGGGFRMRPVTTGREDSVNAEILSGLEFGETVATKNTFTLKAELGKAEAEHEH